ncbi:uncharacterized protein LOC110601238 isoform X2 [Manihot esculenta]|uniref:uncharacterized protein LOC110601238 isoform X2 n=1 Tax=Manihot esculenta TaxID=3983 RepID=UPI000B5D14E7|nr:uncharacterized protein LOC110601238 isoform X2 [Manihot esculenta]
MFLPVPLNYLVSSNVVGKRNPLADCSLQVLLILNYYHKCMVGDDPITDTSDDSAASDSLPKANTYFSDLPYSKALENARNIELDCVDIEGKTHNGWLVRLPFASLFDTLGMYNKLAERIDDKIGKSGLVDGSVAEDLVVILIIYVICLLSCTFTLTP